MVTANKVPKQFLVTALQVRLGGRKVNFMKCKKSQYRV